MARSKSLSAFGAAAGLVAAACSLGRFLAHREEGEWLFAFGYATYLSLRTLMPMLLERGPRSRSGAD